ncbi:phosphonate transport system substrate-binding protein [Roseivivax lentus]|uniref:Phosphonate transport system substrate-binding protein n=1 Tax=Roseivivax lentus TaxID=633194 RepID=A0A1N7NXL0_9RHOB|nr:phosphate/phosphite/phosphonate ABC transporter substrate-binding protein [Roseivivax lentus]SIT03060.1 phosphonate transport system substrate-binding protein [Roseivivax lentus]
MTRSDAGRAGLHAARRGLAAALALLTLSGGAAAETFGVGVVPQFEPRMLSEIWSPILEELGERTGHEFVLVGSPDIAGFEQSFIEGAFDFAYMNPYHGLKAAEAQGYAPILRDGGRSLFGVLVVAEASEYRSVGDLEGKTIAFPSPNALGAALLMRADLDRVHGLDYQAEYVSTHSSAYLNVALGVMDAAGGVMATLNRLEPEIRDGLRIIYETSKLPPHPVVVHPRVDAEIAANVQAAFLDMAETPQGQALLERVPFRDIIAATADDYEVLRTFRLQDYWVEH